MSFSLILNNTNVSGPYKNNYVYRFVNGSFSVEEDMECCISNMTIPFSFFNINASVYGNNTFSYNFPTAGASNAYTINNVVLKNGFYTLSDINLALQQNMITLGQYLINADGTYQYFIQLFTDPIFYANQILEFVVPTSLGPGQIIPPLFWGFPNVAITPQFIINNSGFGDILGFSGSASAPGYYPPTGPALNIADYSVLSNITPNASPVNSLIMTLNIVNNPVVMPSNILDSCPINSNFGDNINYSPPFEKWIGLSKGKYATINLTILDQNFNNIAFNDSNVLITLLIRKNPKSTK
jgi:hypothetical protein